jgi:Tol biopolymer transport system component
MIYRYFYIHILFILSLSYISCDTKNPVNDNGGLSPYTQIDFAASWSPDGSKIVFTRRTTELETSGIYILDYPGLNMYMLTSGITDFPDWSYDSRYILYSEGGGLRRINMTGDSIEFLLPANPVRYSSWKWNPEWVTLSLGNEQDVSFDINLYNVSTNELISLDEKGVNPSWNRTGDKIAYLKPVLDESGARIGDSLMIFEVALNNKIFVKDLRQPDYKISSYPKMRADKIYFSSMDSDGKTYVYSINVNGSNLVKLVANQSIHPDITPGGKLIYTNREHGNGFLWEMDISTGVKRQITF